MTYSELLPGMYYYSTCKMASEDYSWVLRKGKTDKEDSWLRLNSKFYHTSGIFAEAGYKNRKWVEASESLKTLLDSWISSNGVRGLDYIMIKQESYDIC